MIAHITTAHNREDSRIFIKELGSLGKHFKDIYFLVADGKCNHVHNGINIISYANNTSRFKRFFISPFLLIRMVFKLKPKIIHFHDPEILMLTPLFHILGSKVIYDVHEDYAATINDKEYIPKQIRFLVSKVYKFIERIFINSCDVIIAATPFISNLYKGLHELVYVIANYSKKDDIYAPIKEGIFKDEFSFLGVSSKERGLIEVVKAINISPNPIKLNIIGPIENQLREEIIMLDYNKKVNILGSLNREAIKSLLPYSLAGIVTFHPYENHINAYPNKLFEYCALGLPAIYSNFPLWKKLMNYDKTGIAVDPLDPNEISDAMDYLYNNQVKGIELGKEAQRLFLHQYNWDSEEKKLLEIYNQLYV